MSIILGRNELARAESSGKHGDVTKTDSLQR